MSLCNEIKDFFPNLKREVYNRKLVYLDSAASTLKHINSINAVNEYYTHNTSNIHRGIHFLSELATSQYESTRDKLKDFINAEDRNEIIFTSGTTMSVNLVANSYGELLRAGDEIIISHMEHHSNIVPWQLLQERRGIKLKVAPINTDGEIEIEAYKKLFTDKTKLVSIVHTSNTLGTVNPIKELAKIAHDNGALFMTDAAQGITHQKIDVQDLDVDFLAFSGHKMFGPTGIGVLYGKKDLLNNMPPFFGGGDMIDRVTFEKTTFNTLPHKFEAGTPNIAAGIGLGPAIDFINKIGFDNIHAHEQALLNYATEKLLEIDGLKIFGTSSNKTSVISFSIKDVHPQDLATIIDKKGVAIRTGHHCTQPVMDYFQVPAMARASFSIYNNTDDIDILVSSINSAIKLFRG